MRIKLNEHGRSMVEILGVLAIIGILSIGGIASYQYAYSSYQAGQIQDVIGNEGWVWSDGTIDYFDKEKLYQMYLDAIANGDLPEGITWEEFLSWFGDQGDRYAFPIPSGVWFMCFLALGYGLYIAYRRKQKVVNS